MKELFEGDEIEITYARKKYVASVTTVNRKTYTIHFGRGPETGKGWCLYNRYMNKETGRITKP